MAPGRSRRATGASPCQVVPSSFPLCYPSCQGSCRRVQPLTLVGKALIREWDVPHALALGCLFPSPACSSKHAPHSNH